MLETSPNISSQIPMHTAAPTADGLLFLPWVNGNGPSYASKANLMPMVSKNDRIDWSSSFNRSISRTDFAQRLCHSLSDLTVQSYESTKTELHISPKRLGDAFEAHSNSDSELCHPSHGQQHFSNSENLHKHDSYHTSKSNSGYISRNGADCITKSCIKKAEDSSTDDIPKTKKAVSFADASGGVLFTVKVVKESTYEPPSNIRKFLKKATRHIKPSVTKNSTLFDRLNGNGNGNISSTLSSLPFTVWRCCFQQPASQYISFREKLERDFVSLENIVINMGQLLVHGTIKVRNLSFWKEVSVRVTTNRWNTHEDNKTIYQPCSDPHPRFDTFAFSFLLPKSSSSTDANLKKALPFQVDPVDIVRDEVTHLEFAVCYRCEAGEFWDSNNGHNYVLERRRPSLTTPLEMISLITEERANTNGNGNGNTVNSPNSNTTNDKVDSLRTRGPQLMPYTVDMRPNFETFDSLTDYRSWQHYSGEGSYY